MGALGGVDGGVPTSSRDQNPPAGEPTASPTIGTGVSGRLDVRMDMLHLFEKGVRPHRPYPFPSKTFPELGYFLLGLKPKVSGGYASDDVGASCGVARASKEACDAAAPSSPGACFQKEHSLRRISSQKVGSLRQSMCRKPRSVSM